MGAGRGRRTGIILIILILVVVLIAVGALFLLQRLGQVVETAVGEGMVVSEVDQVMPTPTPPSLLQIIVAARDIPRGARLSVQDVTIMNWPLLDEAPPPIGVLVVSSELGLDQVAGRISRVDILNGQPVLDFMITPGDQPIGLADRGSDAALGIPSGMVGVALPITRLSSVAYAPREGDHVDILMSFTFVDVNEEYQTMLPNTGIMLLQVQPEEGPATIQQIGEFPTNQDVQEQRGPFGTAILIVPTTGEFGQIARRTTQLVIDNAIVLRMGTWPLGDIDQPIVVTPAPSPTPVPPQEFEEGEVQPPPPETTGPTPVPAIPAPDVITLAMSRQDALVLKYALEAGAVIDLALRSALDDDINDISTDPVTLDYIINFYNVSPPVRLPVALDPRVNLLTQFGLSEQPVGGATE